MEEFSRSFDAVDYLLITDIYAASETPIEGVNSQKLLDLIKTSLTDKLTAYCPKDKIAEHIMKIIVPGDMVITIGAGDIVRLSDELAERLKNKD
jgi:UDP-N-acetylmuramate--alanine ligase